MRSRRSHDGSWIESGWTVTEREAPDLRVPIRPRHICILFRRMNSFGRDVTRSYLRALEARHLPHVLVKGGSFNEREEVIAIRNLLGAIERPDDELLVFAALRGPIFALVRRGAARIPRDARQPASVSQAET